MKAFIANTVIPSALAAAMLPVVACAMEIKTPTVSVPHIVVPHVNTPSANTHVTTPQVKLHVITPKGDAGGKITNTNSDNTGIGTGAKLQNKTTVLQQQSLGSATSGASGRATLSPYSITREIDSTTPSFFVAGVSGARFSLHTVDFTGKASVVSLIPLFTPIPIASAKAALQSEVKTINATVAGAAGSAAVESDPLGSPSVNGGFPNSQMSNGSGSTANYTIVPGGTPGASISKEQLDNVVDGLKQDIDSQSELGEMASLRLQMAMDRMSKFEQTLANMLKKIDNTQSAITQNLK